MKKYFTSLILLIGMLISINAFSIPNLNSLPSSPFVIYLDFDGQYVVSGMWNQGNPINCAAAGMTDAEITEAFNRVSEDYRPFNVNITTDSTKYLAAPLTQRQRIIITPTSAWYPGAAGISWLGSFTWGDGTPSFVFCDRLPLGGPISPKRVGEAVSHESGHTLGLSHQSRYGASCVSPIEEYHSGGGAGEISWAPIMGWSLDRNMTGWNNGPTPYGCTDLQDNLTIISTYNGFTYRADDYSEVMNASTTLLNGSNFNTSGIISTTTDKDAFRLVFAQNSNFHLDAVPFSVGANDNGADLDIKILLYNSGGNLIRTYDPANSMSVAIDTILNTGTYYILVDGTGNLNATEYGSLGSYTLTGAVSGLPIHEVSLNGNNANNKHNLGWNIIADEPVKKLEIQVSSNGTDFTTLTPVAYNAKTFAYQPYQNNTLYYRLKVTSILDQSVYSNTVALHSTGNTGKPFQVSTLVENDITVNAAENFEYSFSNANGQPISKGKAPKGISRINISNQPNGLYILMINSNNNKQTERIIKQ